MCICDGCGKLINREFYYCPWCGYSRVEQSKEDCEKLRYAQFKAKKQEVQSQKIGEMEDQLDDLEKELSVLALSYQMAR